MSDLQEKSVNEAGLEMAQKILLLQRKEEDDVRFSKRMPYIRRFSVLISILIILIAYFFSPFAKVSSISISGTNRLNDAYIQQISKLSTNSFIDFVFSNQVVKKLKQDTLVKDASLTKGSNNTIQLTIVENKIVGYYYPEDSDVAKVLLADGNMTDLQSAYLDLISQVPYISGFDDTYTKKIAKAMDKVDDSMISQIAEITRYSLSYNANVLKILMRNGGYFIADINGVYKLNYYNEIYENLSNTQYCIYATDTSNTAYSAVCPWDEAASEYWTDENGNYILNSAGDKAVKHYYTDASGNPAKDANGNKIAIPLNQNGDEQMDPDFLDHYAAGYYSTGVLVIPQ